MKLPIYFRAALVLTLSFAAFVCVRGQALQPDGGGVRAGVLPRSWNVSGPTCGANPQFQMHGYNADFFILRESGCSNYEKPFLFLIFGKEKVLLLDTGAGKTDVADVVQKEIHEWLGRNKRESIPLIVAHTHAHRDHIGGDEQLKVLPNATVVEPNVSAVQAFFGFHDWPTQVAQYDLGGRILDVIPIPGHEASSIAVYDRETGILFAGDTLYPDGSTCEMQLRIRAAFSGWWISHREKSSRIFWGIILKRHALRIWIIRLEPFTSLKNIHWSWGVRSS